ncbi:MAG TPA: hypothetical protein VFN28_06305 [Amaricoccus sp.]|jgi:hypothetical protein|nr:hypothetical protein [Amaricoccus sp.]
MTGTVEEPSLDTCEWIDAAEDPGVLGWWKDDEAAAGLPPPEAHPLPAATPGQRSDLRI